YELGRGAMGVVWLARERRLERLVALKLIRTGSDPHLSQRLLREGQAAARLRHPNIVAVHALGGSGTSAYLAMDFIEGGNLETRVRAKPMPPRQAAALVAKLAGALAHAHAAGVLHRDVKPSNILLDPDGEPQLADFGLAAPLDGAGDLTLPGVVAGTPAYLAPELLKGAERACPQTDVYGLGAVLYACLTGRPPFAGDSVASLLSQVASNDPLAPRLFQPGLPRDLATICLKCLEKPADRRYASARQLQEDLEAFLDRRPIAARPVGRLGRAARSCRRHPALAASSALAAVLLLALAIGGPLMALRLARSRRAAVESESRARRAEAATLERLRDSLLARSRALQLSGRRGQRDDALAAATEAARIRGGLDARDAVIAALAEPEFVSIRKFAIRRDFFGVIAFDADHDRYALETAPGRIELRRLSDNRLIQALRGPPIRLLSLPTFSADGRWLAARNAAAEELVWRDGRPDPVLRMEHRPYVLGRRFTEYGRPEAFSPDGRQLASSLPGSGVALIATKDGREIGRIPTSGAVTHLAYSPDGRWLAIGRGLGGTNGENPPFVRVFDRTRRAETGGIGKAGSFQTLSWSPGGDRLLLTGEEIRVLAVPDGSLLARFDDPFAINGFFGPGGTTLITSAGSGLATVWNIDTGRRLLEAELGADPEISVSRDGRTIAKSIGAGSVGLYGLEMPRVVHASPIAGTERTSVLSAAVSVVDYSPDGRWLATADWGGVQLRTAGGAILAAKPVGSRLDYCSVRFSRDGRSLLLGTSELGFVRVPIETPQRGAPSLGPSVTIDPERGFFITDVSSDGSRALLSSPFASGMAKIVWLDGSSPSKRWKLNGAAGGAFVDGGRDVVVNSLESDHGAPIEIRDGFTGALLRTVPYSHGAHAHASGNGSLVVLGVGPGRTVLLHAADWSPGPSLPAEVQGREFQAAISRDGKWLAFGVADQACLVRAADGAMLAHLRSPQTGTYLPGLAFSPDGARLALWWDDSVLTVWDLRALRRKLAARNLDW
ncbi:MAG: WD40 repeat domain-containing serine/threonine protein kinase, partial [Opitutaceae bacterium]